jgi:esterase/lipase superfamily enzyme
MTACTGEDAQVVVANLFIVVNLQGSRVTLVTTAMRQRDVFGEFITFNAERACRRAGFPQLASPTFSGNTRAGSLTLMLSDVRLR